MNVYAIIWSSFPLSYEITETNAILGKDHVNKFYLRRVIRMSTGILVLVLACSCAGVWYCSSKLSIPFISSSVSGSICLFGDNQMCPWERNCADSFNEPSLYLFIFLKLSVSFFVCMLSSVADLKADYVPTHLSPLCVLWCGLKRISCNLLTDHKCWWHRKQRRTGILMYGFEKSCAFFKILICFSRT